MLKALDLLRNLIWIIDISVFFPFCHFVGQNIWNSTRFWKLFLPSTNRLKCLKLTVKWLPGFSGMQSFFISSSPCYINVPQFVWRVFLLKQETIYFMHCKLYSQELILIFDSWIFDTTGKEHKHSWEASSSLPTLLLLPCPTPSNLTGFSFLVLSIWKLSIVISLRGKRGTWSNGGLFHLRHEPGKVKFTPRSRCLLIIPEIT